jgi:hypothetical protein
MIRVDEETYNRIAGYAAANGRTIVGQLRWWVVQADRQEQAQVAEASK